MLRMGTISQLISQRASNNILKSHQIMETLKKYMKDEPNRHGPDILNIIATSCSPLVVRPWDLVVENAGVISAPQRGVVATPGYTNPLHVRLVNNLTDL